MLQVGENSYPLCLLDTMAISEIVKDDGAFANFLSWSMATDPPWVACFSPFTMIELRRQPWLFEAFIERFELIVIALLKGYDWTLEEEIAQYPDPSGLDICAIAFTPLGDEGNLIKNLPKMHVLSGVEAKEAEWNSEQQSIIDGMLSLVENYPPAGDKYTPSEIRDFIEIAGLSQLVYKDPDFVKRHLDRDDAVQLDAFPSLKASLYTAFYKFYVDKIRRPSRSDAFDILIAAGLPYVEAVITEAHQADVLRKVRRIDHFLDHVDVLTLRDLRTGLTAA